MNPITINYYTKEIYGQQLIYLAKESDRALWQSLTGKKTASAKDLENLSKLTGVTLNRVFEKED